MNLFRWIAATRTRLMMSVALGFALWLGLAVPLASHMRDASTSVTVDLLLMTAIAFVILATATFTAILIGDRVFPGRWRERVILGRNVSAELPDDELATVTAMKSYVLHFCIVLVMVLFASAWLFETMTGGFFDEYSRHGHLRTTMRSDKTETKLALLDELAEHRRKSFVLDALETLDIVWRDERQPVEVRVKALHSLGQLSIYLVSAVDTWIKEGRPDSWQLQQLQKLRRTVAPDLRRLQAEASPEIQREMLFTLGSMRDRQSLDLLLSKLGAGADDPQGIWRTSVISLGRLRKPEALGPLVTQLGKADSDVAFEAIAWSVRELLSAYHKGNLDLDKDLHTDEIKAVMGRIADGYGETAISGALTRRCIAALVLKVAGAEDIRQPLFAAFDAPGADGQCKPVGVDTGDRVPGWIGQEEPLRQRIIDALGLVALGDFEVDDWAKARLEKGGLDEHTAALLTDLRTQINKRQ